MIANERYFVAPDGSAAFSVSVARAGADFAVRIEAPDVTTRTGDPNAVLAVIDEMTGALSAAREAMIIYLTEGT